MITTTLIIIILILIVLYILKLAESQTDKNIIEIYDALEILYTQKNEQQKSIIEAQEKIIHRLEKKDLNNFK